MENRSTYGMIDLNKLDKEKQPVMSNILKPISNQFEGVK